jgi:hypothetical protein
VNLAPIVQRLRTVATTFKSVGGAAEYDAALDAQIVTPSAYVVELSSNPRQQGSYTLTVVTQTVEVTVAVIIAIKHRSDIKGDGDQSPLEAARTAARMALLGWQAAPDNEPLTYVGGQLLDFEPGMLWWQDVYVTTETITNRNYPA